MAYEHDPNRSNRPRSSYESASSSWGLIVIALVVAGALAFIFLLLPSSDTTQQRVTENAPNKVERPATTPTPTPTPPAKSPAPTTPPGGTPVPSTPPAQK